MIAVDRQRAVRFLCGLSADRQALLICERKKSPQFCGAGPHPRRTGSRNSAGQVWGDSARFGFYPLTSIHFGCRPLFGSRLLGEVIA